MAPSSEPDNDIITAINITPLVDIFLVLLIIFMITSSVIDYREINISLPKMANAGSIAPVASGLVLDQEGKLFIDGLLIDSAGLHKHLIAAKNKNHDHEVLVAAHQDLAYKKVVWAVDIIRGAGISKYALKVIRKGT